MSPILEVLTSNFSKLEDLPPALYYALRNSYGLTKEDLQDLLKVKLTVEDSNKLVVLELVPK